MNIAFIPDPLASLQLYLSYEDAMDFEMVFTWECIFSSGLIRLHVHCCVSVIGPVSEWPQLYSLVSSQWTGTWNKARGLCGAFDWAKSCSSTDICQTRVPYHRNCILFTIPMIDFSVEPKSASCTLCQPCNWRNCKSTFNSCWKVVILSPVVWSVGP